MAIEGPLRELGLHDVFQLLELSRKTGVLRVTSPLRRNQGTVYFDRGAVVAAEIRSNPHPLGELLVRAGRVTEGELQMARDLQTRGDGRRLGEILVDQGVLGQRELERQVRLQIEEVVFEVIGWREGYFSFSEGPITELRVEATARIPTEALLMEGARRIDEWSRIERQIPHLGVVPALAPGGESSEGALDLHPAEWEVLGSIDGARDLREIAALIGRSEFDVAKTVFGLYSSGVVTLEDQRRDSPRDGEVAALDDSVALIRRLLAEGDAEGARLEAEALAAVHGQNAAVHVLAARAELAAGRPREAELVARRALGLDPALAGAHRLLGDALAAQGRFQDAVSWWVRWSRLEEDGVGDADRAAVTAATAAARRLHDYLRGRHGG